MTIPSRRMCFLSIHRGTDGTILVVCLCQEHASRPTAILPRIS